jgi:type IV pilus assembly protein PilC
MADFVLKYADGRGQIHHQVATAASEKELRDKYAQQGFLIYSIKARAGGVGGSGFLGGRKKLNLEKFLIFNQQFVTLIRAGLPILKALDLLAERLTDPKLGPYVKSVRDEVRGGTLLSEAFRQQGIFPKIYVTSVMAGEKSGSLTEVMDRYVNYQKLSLAVRKKIMVSLMYPCVLIVLVVLLMVFLVTYVVPTFANLYSSMQAKLPIMTVYLIAVGTASQKYIVFFAAALVGGIFLFRWWARRDSAQEKIDQVKLHLPLLGEIWLKYQVAQLARILGTLLVGGIPLVQAMETAADSLGTRLLQRAVEAAGKSVREGQPLSGSLKQSKLFPPLAIDMIEVGESTGALPAMLNSVAEFFEEDVNTKMAATLSLIEPAIMIVMGGFVAFVLIALYLPIFSLADTIR